MSEIKFKSIEELEEGLRDEDWVDLTETINRARQKMVEKSESKEEEDRRYRDSLATAAFLQQPVIYSK